MLRTVLLVLGRRLSQSESMLANSHGWCKEYSSETDRHDQEEKETSDRENIQNASLSSISYTSKEFNYFKDLIRDSQNAKNQNSVPLDNFNEKKSDQTTRFRDNADSVTKRQLEATDTVLHQSETSSQQSDASSQQSDASSQQSEASSQKSEASLQQSETSLEQSETSLQQSDASSQQYETSLQQSETSLEVGEDKPVKVKSHVPVYNLAALINESDTLQNLLKFGVDLSAIEKYPDIAEHILKMDFEKDVSPFLSFLTDYGVEDYGKYLSRNPFLLKQSLEDLAIRINYLESKKFTKTAIERIVSKAPLFLSLKVEVVDRKLGFLQKSFILTGNEVREVATKLPKIITWKLDKIKDNRFYMKEFLGFTAIEMKKMLVTYPKLFLMDKHSVGKKFDHLHNVMELQHNRLVEYPNIFNTRLFIIKHRHRYLLKVDRAQYDPDKEHYVSLQALSTGTDSEFCVNVAKTSVREFNDFMKCI